MPRTSFQGTASRSQVSSNNNPRGINQYKDCPAPDDPRIPEFLKEYQRKGITDKKKISKFLLDEHGIIMSDSTVARRRRELGLKASGKTTADLPDDVKRQLVLDQMAKDTAGQIGTLTVKTRIFQETGIDLTRYLRFHIVFMPTFYLYDLFVLGGGLGKKCEHLPLRLTKLVDPIENIGKALRQQNIDCRATPPETEVLPAEKHVYR
ncbi:hypothetical protein C0989_003307 [Termitomyces sp. Mn162]|nr:hypothetical protein C0989_003307 [Termitomyces sp. Mn162]